ncbi:MULTISPECIES: tRNA (guanosine(46)-N7)-methyltransferase TrmB [Chromobacterium]|uniref:tRNA (guanine-N(7)-)-methyltransferase n=2 Tax=Chromobacterium TaxID=535 RepID=A0ABS3GMW7_9NEIS|nr:MULTISPECIES: tRNA (guanosine(46)-N7)-methyltransferase TrmB [Chromobacterium]AXT48092.1 tRNA (guanosine(46)-N7)-methyltransferase TrmB [Chromobacterium rhizoryzae]MBK0414930.1 tRNA (guanosine(46)-N7)-methyltransferase TrmB [Chromobacterium haemolyticum]MBO0416400.1 tRNA (guanosine(46)-N7)-methyltransferase TrmB [Chromobacterium haemolyticum]MBO0499569.1 tRNA (guanosine(46)-N7)-methyltransferase TrmB [Chromobacterium haemolyticum]OQS39534.1 tRNA (guanine(46)-N(7))-methyltransferase [Chromob
MENPAFQRAIRSFVLRQGHLSTGQQRAMDEGMPRWGIEYRPERIDLEQAFGRAAPKILEIGFGMGGATAEIAAANPDQDYLGVEVHSPGVGNLCKLIAEKELSNLRIIRHDAVEVLDHMLADGSLDGVHIFFPDPWHKKRHNKRRLIQAPLVEKLITKLKPGGYLHAATDWEDYALQIMDVFSSQPQLVNTADGYAPRPDYRPLTKFEARGIKLGHGVWDVIFRRL